ncbi:hypothetical protein [Streptomyces sp. NBC_00280]|uniref:hypothetical protein n=1 Tax=Streptomyces sp. NBC_00280 TaxID=2975699 RepID=UPI00352DB10D
MRRVPDERITATVAFRPWLEEKVAAVPAHRTEGGAGNRPGLTAGLSASEQERLLSTDEYIRRAPVSAVAARTELTVHE